MSKILCPLNAAAKEHGTLPAIISGDRIVSYAEYDQMVASVAVRLSATDITPGQRIAIVSNNSWEHIILLIAILRLGAVACPINPRFPRESILSILRRNLCSTLVDPQDLLSLSSSGDIRKLDLAALFGISQAESVTGETAVDLEADATIILTSGTSSGPKAALHSYGNHYYSALGSNNNIAIQPSDRWLMSLPLFHVGGLSIVFRMLLGGGVVVIPEAKEDIWESFDKYNITHASLVSTQLYRLLNEELAPQTVRRLKAVLVGGGPVSSSLIAKAYEAGLLIHTTYGSTEMASQVTTTAANDSRECFFTCGRTLDHRSLKIDNGEILVRGETLFKGYVEGEKTTSPVDQEGWFRTGDLGQMDDDGYLTFLGRKDNMFISGGENICPEEIEGMLCLLSGISQALVVPIQDKEFGFRPVAFLRAKGNKSVHQKRIISSLERHLPRFKIPVAFHKWSEEADTDGIKPDRQYLAQLAEKLTRQ